MAATDEQLIARFQASGVAADLEELIQRHLGRVRNLAYRVVQCSSTADDIAQEVFIKVMQSAPTFRGKASVSTWLYKITLNTANEFLRNKSRQDTLLKESHVRNVQRNSQPDQTVIQAEMMAEIEQALARLSLKLRTAIVLTAMEQLSTKEAAEVAGCSTTTMHWRIHQARKQLKQRLHRYLKS